MKISYILPYPPPQTYSTTYTDKLPINDLGDTLDHILSLVAKNKSGRRGHNLSINNSIAASGSPNYIYNFNREFC